MNCRQILYLGLLCMLLTSVFAAPRRQEKTGKKNGCNRQNCSLDGTTTPHDDTTTPFRPIRGKKIKCKKICKKFGKRSDECKACKKKSRTKTEVGKGRNGQS